MNPIRTFFVWTLTATVLLSSATLFADEKQNLLPNGDFQSHHKAKVTSWISQTNTPGKAIYLQDGDNAAVQLIGAGSDQDRWFLPNAHTPAVEAGKYYQLSVEAKTAHLDEDDNVRAAMIWLDADRKTIAAEQGDRIEGNHASIIVSVTAKAPANAVSVRPMLILSNGKNNAMPKVGNVIFDNASLHQVDAPKQAQVKPAPNPFVFKPAPLTALPLAQLTTLWQTPGVQSTNTWAAPIATCSLLGDGKILQTQDNLISLQLDDVKKKFTL
ncbi:MAG: hypothetical protein CMJ19_09050 [Phycisphaeraceae bacterium]|nr:hypothetical protein [Phycisphaeraceae bacterium]